MLHGLKKVLTTVQAFRNYFHIISQNISLAYICGVNTTLTFTETVAALGPFVHYPRGCEAPLSWTLSLQLRQCFHWSFQQGMLTWVLFFPHSGVLIPCLGPMWSDPTHMDGVFNRYFSCTEDTHGKMKNPAEIRSAAHKDLLSTVMWKSLAQQSGGWGICPQVPRLGGFMKPCGCNQKCLLTTSRRSSEA